MFVIGDENNEPAEASEVLIANPMVCASMRNIEERTVEDVTAQLEGEQSTTDVLDKDTAKKVSPVEAENEIQCHPSCSETQSTNGVPSSGSEASSTQVSSATGSPPACELPRSGCENIEGVMLSEHVGYHSAKTLFTEQNPPSTFINEKSKDSVTVKNTPGNDEVVEDGKNIACPLTSPQVLHKIEGKSGSVTE